MLKIKKKYYFKLKKTFKKQHYHPYQTMNTC